MPPLESQASSNGDALSQIGKWMRKPWMVMIYTVGPCVIVWFIISFLVQMTN